MDERRKVILFVKSYIGEILEKNKIDIGDLLGLKDFKDFILDMPIKTFEENKLSNCKEKIINVVKEADIEKIFNKFVVELYKSKEINFEFLLAHYMLYQKIKLEQN